MNGLLMVGLRLLPIFLCCRLTRWLCTRVLPVLLTGVLVWLGWFSSWAVAVPLNPGPAASSGVDNPGVTVADTVSSGGAADAGDIPSEMVSRFVAAYLAVVELIDSREATLQRAETDTESRQLQQELQQEALGLIQDHGLTLQTYWELLALANSDPEFRERVLAQVEEASL